MNLCIIGNSHTICLKEAIDANGTDHSICFFFAPATQLSDFAVVDGALWSDAAMASVAANPIAIDKQDAFLVCGLQLTIATVASIYESCCTFDMPREGHALISAHFLADVAHERVANALAFRVARTLRISTDKPILVMPQPYPMENAKSEDVRLKPRREEKRKNIISLYDHLKSVGPEASRLFSETAKQIAQESGLTMLPQPPASIADHCFTRADFQSRPGDYTHANAAYGQLVLDDLQRHFTT